MVVSVKGPPLSSFHTYYMTIKQCITCSASFEDKSRPQSGKFCSAECQYETKKQRHLERRKVDAEYAAEHRTRGRRKRLMRNYGLTLEKFDELLTSQNGVCKICLKTCSTNPHLSVEHNHKTGKVRGLVCHKCNQIIRLFDEQPEVMQRIMEYLKEEITNGCIQDGSTRWK